AGGCRMDGLRRRCGRPVVRTSSWWSHSRPTKLVRGTGRGLGGAACTYTAGDGPDQGPSTAPAWRRPPFCATIHAAVWVRAVKPSFFRMDCTWPSAVRSEMNSRSPISPLARPWATSSETSRSRLLRARSRPLKPVQKHVPAYVLATVCRLRPRASVLGEDPPRPGDEPGQESAKCRLSTTRRISSPVTSLVVCAIGVLVARAVGGLVGINLSHQAADATRATVKLP